MKKGIGVFVVLFLLVNPLVLADHGFWNEVSDWWGDFSRENVAGKQLNRGYSRGGTLA